MADNIEAIRVLASEMKKMINGYLKSASFDKTKIGIITAVLSYNKYSVKIEGTVYTVPSGTSDIYKVNDVVSVLFPENDVKRKRIIGREV